MRFERSALFAYENGFNVYATTLGISRWKDMDQINDSGHRRPQEATASRKGPPHGSSKMTNI